MLATTNHGTSTMPHGDTDLLTRHPWVTRRSLTVAEYHKMGEAGILTEDDRVELIEGQLVAMTPIGSNHSGTINALTYTLVQRLRDAGIVAVQNPVRLGDLSEPQPDFAVLRPRDDFYRRSTPTPEDVILIIEVADSSLAYDRAIKRSLYARHGIPEFWIVDLTADAIEVHRDPAGDDYSFITRVGRDGSVSIALLPDVAIPAAAFLV
jgi:Uma2 family endonuclease